MNIIVTGGAGFIGSNFVFHMLKKYPDYRVICLDKLTYAGNLSTLAPVMDNPNFRFVKADICNREAVDVALDITDKNAVEKVITEVNPDAVIHCAAWTAVDMAEDDDKVAKVRAINAGGTQNIADVCKKLNCKMTYRYSFCAG